MLCEIVYVIKPTQLTYLFHSNTHCSIPHMLRTSAASSVSKNAAGSSEREHRIDALADIRFDSNMSSLHQSSPRCMDRLYNSMPRRTPSVCASVRSSLRCQTIQLLRFLAFVLVWPIAILGTVRKMVFFTSGTDVWLVKTREVLNLGYG